jgi:hypothetical protein
MVESIRITCRGYSHKDKDTDTDTDTDRQTQTHRKRHRNRNRNRNRNRHRHRHRHRHGHRHIMRGTIKGSHTAAVGGACCTVATVPEASTARGRTLPLSGSMSYAVWFRKNSKMLSRWYTSPSSPLKSSCPTAAAMHAVGARSVPDALQPAAPGKTPATAAFWARGATHVCPPPQAHSPHPPHSRGLRLLPRSQRFRLRMLFCTVPMPSG